MKIMRSFREAISSNLIKMIKIAPLADESFGSTGSCLLPWERDFGRMSIKKNGLGLARGLMNTGASIEGFQYNFLCLSSNELGTGNCFYRKQSYNSAL